MCDPRAELVSTGGRGGGKEATRWVGGNGAKGLGRMTPWKKCEIPLRKKLWGFTVITPPWRRIKGTPWGVYYEGATRTFLELHGYRWLKIIGHIMF